jgi:hypothetical protein
LNEQPRSSILLCATVWWPLSARLAIAFLRYGCRVSALCPPGHPLRSISGVGALHVNHVLQGAAPLRAAIEREKPDIVIPCDDGAAWQMHELCKSTPEFRPLIESSLGAPEAYSALDTRGEVLKIATELGIRSPLTEEVTSPEDLKNWRHGWPAVLKVDGTWGGEGVSIVRSLSEARAAYRRIFGGKRALLAWKRYLINRHPIALWSWNRRNSSNISLQEYIPGQPATTMFACWQGEVLASVTVEVLASQGATGAATIVQLQRHEEIEQAARVLARKFKLNGFHGLDFILETGSRAAFLIEMNPRATQLGHLNVTEHGDLAGVLAAKLRGDSLPAVAPDGRIPNDIIAFFPQAWNANPKSPLLARGYHDVPWEEPALVRELTRESWPERQLLNRVFTLFRARKQAIQADGFFQAAKPNLTL